MTIWLYNCPNSRVGMIYGIYLWVLGMCRKVLMLLKYCQNYFLSHEVTCVLLFNTSATCSLDKTWSNHRKLRSFYNWRRLYHCGHQHSFDIFILLIKNPILKFKIKAFCISRETVYKNCIINYPPTQISQCDTSEPQLCCGTFFFYRKNVK